MYYPDIDTIRQFTDLMRAAGVSHLKFGDIEIHLDLYVFATLQVATPGLNIPKT